MGRGATTPPPDPGDTFQLGITEPTALNTGYLPETVSRPVYAGVYQGLVGSNDPLQPTIISGQTLTNNLLVASGYVDVFDNDIIGSPTDTRDMGMITCWGPDVKRVRVWRNRFRPQNPHAHLDAIRGHHFEAVRNDVSYVVDGFGVFNQYQRSASVKIHGNYVHDLVHYYDPTIGVVHPSDTDTHNDGVQVQGGEDIEIIGNSFWGYGKEENGSASPGEFFRSSQGIVIQQNVAVASNGAFYMMNIKANYNWFRGFMHVISAKTRSTNGTPYDLEWLGNRLMDSNQRTYPGAPYHYLLRIGTQTLVNGISYPTTGYTNDTVGGNVFANSLDVEVAYRGQPWYVRRDNSPI